MSVVFANSSQTVERKLLRWAGGDFEAEIARSCGHGCVEISDDDLTAMKVLRNAKSWFVVAWLVGTEQCKRKSTDMCFSIK